MRAEHHSAWVTGLYALAAVLYLASSLFGATTGQLSGLVVDQAGSPLPGVTVSAASPAQIGGAQLAQTDPGGRFQYPRLAPGSYTVQTALDGFLTQQFEGVQVRLDRMTVLHVTLAQATFSEQINVVERTPVVDPEQVSLGHTYTSRYLQEALLGMENRSLTGIVGQAAGVRPDGNYVDIMGGGSNNFVIDGIDQTDPVYNVATFGFQTGQINLDAVDEIAFHTAGFEAEYGRAEGGVVNLITKSGGNSYSGSLDFRFSDTDLQSSGSHFDPEEQLTENSDLNFSLGGPLVRDRLWFFGTSGRFSDEDTPFGAPTTSRIESENYLGKLTWQPEEDWSLVVKLMTNSVDWQNEGSSQFRTPEATTRHSWETWAGHLALSGTLSDRLLYGLRAGMQRSSWEYQPQSGDLTTIGHYNLDTGEFYANAQIIQSVDDRDRNELDSDLTWYIDDLGGQHEIKGGARYSDIAYSQNWCNTGSGRPCVAGDETYLFRDIFEQGNYAPGIFRVQLARDPQTFPGSIWSVYAQDAWRFRSDVTAKLGLRWDRSRLASDLGHQLADLSLLQPRVGIAWDLHGKGRDVLRASWGRFMHLSSLEVAQFAAGRRTPVELWYSCSYFGFVDPDSCSAFTESRSYRYRTDPESWDPVGWILQPGNVLSTEPSQVSPDLEPRYSDELVLSYEREIYRRTSVELSYVDKASHRLAEDTCNGNVPTATEGADCSYYFFYNLPGLRKSYEAFILRFESRALDELHVLGSYTYSNSRGQGPGFDLTSAFDVYPYHFANQYGYLSDQSRHRVKLNGYVLLPHEWSLAVNSWWDSEFRWTPWDTTVPGMNYGAMFLEPRGSRSESGIYQLDVQVGKGFTWNRTRLRLLATVYNALDTEKAGDVCRAVDGCSGYELGEPIEWQQPRRYEIGARVEFLPE
jgi:hypothetical protein